MIKNIFPTKIWETTYPGYNKEETVRKFDEYIERVGTNRYNWIIADSDTTAHPLPPSKETNKYIVDYTDLKLGFGSPELFDWINTQIVEYHKHCGYSRPETFEIAGAWATSTPKGGYLELHNHNPRITAGVFYVDASSEQGDLHILNPNEMVIGKNQYYDGYDFPDKWYQFPVQSGKLVLFPGYIYHYVPKNPTENARKIISFDVIQHHR